jgi:SAM-dependent methyltransferase
MTLAPVEYSDTEDHLVNAVLRLLHLTRAEFEQWRQLAGDADGDVLRRLASGWAALRPPPEAPSGADLAAPVLGPSGESGTVWHPAIAENAGWGFARSGDRSFAWLIRSDGGRFVCESTPPVYEENYFEGELGTGGYDSYRDEAGWRLEKASRQVREMRQATQINAGRVLDIGSGYGFFRVALAEAGYEHDGLEVSAHGRAVAAELYGQQTYDGFLEDHVDDWQGRFDAVTGFDLIEHLADPVAFLRNVRDVLAPGGVVGLKTPNLDAPEADVFGPHYHSLKREHLVLLSPESLSRIAAEGGFEPVRSWTVSHLLQGFVGVEQCRQWEHEGRGADIVAWFRRVD